MTNILQQIYEMLITNPKTAFNIGFCGRLYTSVVIGDRVMIVQIDRWSIMFSKLVFWTPLEFEKMEDDKVTDINAKTKAKSEFHINVFSPEWDKAIMDAYFDHLGNKQDERKYPDVWKRIREDLEAYYDKRRSDQ
jgi:hypothetical protein